MRMLMRNRNQCTVVFYRFLSENGQIIFYCPMEQFASVSPDSLSHLETCICNICLRRPAAIITVIPSDIDTPNCMREFIKSLPAGFPLWTEQTVILNRREDSGVEYHSYANPSKDESKASMRQMNKCNVVHQQIRGLSSLSCQNVLLYFQKSERIIPRFQVISLIAQSKGQKMTSEGDILYIQAYTPQPIIRTEYTSGQTSKLDSILLEHIEKQERQFHPQKMKMNEQFLDWVYRQYGEDIFFHFLCILYIKFYQLLTGNNITRGVFFWSMEQLNKDIMSLQQHGSTGAAYNKMMDMGRPKRLTFKPKLINVRQLHIQQHERLFSFQEEYQTLIRSRIQSTSKKTISAIKNRVYRSRLENFRTKIHKIYDEEQASIMSNIRQEKQFEYQHDTDQMARMLIPNMGPYKNLREILSDEKAFREVILNKKTRKTAQKTKKENFTRVQLTPLRKNASSIGQLERKTGNLITPNTGKRYLKLLTTPSTLE